MATNADADLQASGVAAAGEAAGTAVDAGAGETTRSGEDPDDGWIAVGRILGTFGPRGELRVQPLSRFPQRFRELRQVYVGEAHQPAAVLHRRQHGPGLVLRLDVTRTREEARALLGQYLYVPEAEAVTLPKGEYFVHQIVGLAVVTTDGETLGTVSDVLETGSNDVYVVKGPRGEIMLPAIKDVIKQVDLAAGTLLVQLLPGIVD
jgi:16S rRNA processing protein RimM